MKTTGAKCVLGRLGLTLCLVLPSCTGSISGDQGSWSNQPGAGLAGPGTQSGAMDAPGGATPTYIVPATNLRRLTRREYDNTVRDLVGDTSSPAHSFGDDPVGITGYETPGSLGALEVQAFMQAAETLTSGGLTRLPGILACTPSTAAEEEACANKFIRTFGERAFRRPLMDAEASDQLALFQEVRKIPGVTFTESVGAVMQGILESPNFLYHREWGAERPLVENAVLRLPNYELASKLSYFITGSLPDAELLQAAGDGKLTDPDTLTAQAKRLAAKPGLVAGSIADFARQWLQLDVDHLEKNPGRYPEFASLKPALGTELGLFIARIVDQGLSPSALFTDSTVFVNRSSAAAYGVPALDSDELVAVTADPSQRSGVFTQLAFLSTHATSVGSHPVKRGKVLFERALCGIMPAPPPNVPPPAAPQPGQTTRQRFSMHEENACAGCHKSLDPLGFALENYDGIGKYRATEEGQMVDATGSVTLPSGASITFNNGVELMAQLATSSDTRDCLTRHIARYGAIVPEGADERVVAELAGLPELNGGLVDMYVSVVRSTAFRYRALAAGETP